MDKKCVLDNELDGDIPVASINPTTTLGALLDLQYANIFKTTIGDFISLSRYLNFITKEGCHKLVYGYTTKEYIKLKDLQAVSELKTLRPKNYNALLLYGFIMRVSSDSTLIDELIKTESIWVLENIKVKNDKLTGKKYVTKNISKFSILYSKIIYHVSLILKQLPADIAHDPDSPEFLAAFKPLIECCSVSDNIFKDIKNIDVGYL